MMMAGLDGIQNRIHPGDPMDKDLYDLPAEESKSIPRSATRWRRRSTPWTRTASS
jgi:glutamine synthetase